MLKSNESASSALEGGAGAAGGLLFGASGGAPPSFDPFQAATYGGGAMAFNQFANMNQMAFVPQQ